LILGLPYLYTLLLFILGRMAPHFFARELALVPPQVVAAPVAVEDGTSGHVPLCLIQHDDRTDQELGSVRFLVGLNRAVCEADSGCRHVFTRESFDGRVEPHWQKLLAIRAALSRGCTHAVWLDSDAALHTSRAAQMLSAFGGRSFFVSPDPPAELTSRFFGADVVGSWGAPMNAGIWGVRNTRHGLALLDAWIALYPSHLWSIEQPTDHSDGCAVVSRPGGPTGLSRSLERGRRALADLFSRTGHAFATSASSEAGADAADSSSLIARRIAERVRLATEARKERSEAERCGQLGKASYAFHERWRCSGSPACTVWANSDGVLAAALFDSTPTPPAKPISAAPRHTRSLTLARAPRPPSYSHPIPITSHTCCPLSSLLF
jgi:hypothetical protein